VLQEHNTLNEKLKF